MTRRPRRTALRIVVAVFVAWTIRAGTFPARADDPAASPAPSAAPAAAAPAPATDRNEVYVSADALVSPKTYNELSPGTTGSTSPAVDAAAVLGPNGRFLVELDYRSNSYPHTALQTSVPCVVGTPGCNTVNSNGQYQTGTCPAPDPGCITAVGYPNVEGFTKLGQIYARAFTAREVDFDVRATINVFAPHVYAGIGYYQKSYDYLGYPSIGGVGFGISKIPDFDRPLSFYASAWYYPSVTGNYTYPVSPYIGPFSGRTVPFGYAIFKYRAGAALALGHSGVFLDLGFAGEHASAGPNAPSDTSVNALYAGLGYHL
jgi:hypothetical protein